MNDTTTREIVTLQSHILAQQAKNPQSTGTLSWILSALSISAKVIADHVRRARLADVLGKAGAENVQGEEQQKLDVISNDVLMRVLGGREGVAIVASEENEEPVIIRSDTEGEQRYCVLFDPLDGSSNLDVCGSVGTIFSILRYDRRAASPEESLLQPGDVQVAAGYILYGPSTVFCLSMGEGVDMFVLDISVGAFLRVEQGLRIPTASKNYSVNEGNRLGFPEGYQRYLDWAQQNGYSSRYAGAMVADVHRTLLKGGVFMYPPTVKAPNGKLRLMYEANPMAMLIEQAGGKALAGRADDGSEQRILALQPKDIHERCPVVLGSPDEVDHVTRHL
ncbi:MAG: class 1 fructose-bisphosphatase [Gammaproteobacteria bacterium]|nr:class 1 fructose-bisphosphatase [Gammaproteobacteria bacterium]MDH3508660.1 class 1 fructose-bisphosphatase [Gammaproteobacteria bacterium]